MQQTPQGSASVTIVEPLLNANTPDELRGALEAVLAPELGTVLSGELAALIVDTGCYDTSEQMAEVDSAVLTGLHVPGGRHSRILRAIFGESVRSAPAQFTPVQIPQFRFGDAVFPPPSFPPSRCSRALRRLLLGPETSRGSGLLPPPRRPRRPRR